MSIMKLVITALLIAVAANTAALAQYTLDAKGRRYQCLPGDRSYSVLPPQGAPLQPLPQPQPRRAYESALPPVQPPPDQPWR
jgi:hypothetical protein